MSTTRVPAPTSRVQFGLARADITPPVGIYHRMWGAARHDRATGVHRPLVGDVLVFGAADGSGRRMVRACLDLCTLEEEQTEALAGGLAEAAAVPRENVVVTYSHTHSGGWLVSNRISLPGGELIVPYLARLRSALMSTCRDAVERSEPVTITHATGHCAMAGNRDYWDDARSAHVCGFNPDAPADETVVVARITGAANRPVATVVNYACHPTTLAWENSLISPDFVGAMREVVERETGAPCIYAQGACGDLGPRDGFVGDVAVADKNGRQLGHAALAALDGMGPPLTDFRYAGAVISGATLGTWRHEPLSSDRDRDASRFDGGRFQVDLPLKPRPSEEDLRAELADWEARQRSADQRGDAIAARDFGARAERARRWLGRIAALPPGPTYPLPFSVFRLGDAVWVTSGGEPYNVLQRELRRRFPDRTVLFSPLDGGHSVAYLLPADRYGKGLYQEEPSILAPGCLETLIDAIGARVEEVTSRSSR